MFGRLGSWCARRCGVVLVVWVVAIMAVNALASVVGEQKLNDFLLPNFDSTRGSELLDEHFGGLGAGVSGTIVFRADQGIDAPPVKAAMTALFRSLDERDDTVVSSPYEPGGERQIASHGPQAGKIAYAEVDMPGEEDYTAASAAAKQWRGLVPTDVEGLEVHIGGQSFAEFKEPRAEAIGLAFAILILVVAFGSVLAMGLPIGVALAGIAVGAALTTLLSNVVSVPDFAPMLGVMIGLGVGIDYALFIVTRFREQLHKGHSIIESAGIAIDTAGRAVVFAGATVVISFMGMLVMGVPFIAGLAVACATVVTVTVLASLTLLPALLGLAGARVETTRVRGVAAAACASVALVGFGLEIDPLLVGVPLAVVVVLASFAVAPLRRPLPPRKVKPIETTSAYRWSRWVQHHPWSAAIGGAAVLLVLTLPVLGLRLGFSDEGNYASNTPTRKAYDLLAEGFGPGFNGPFLLVAELGGDVGFEDLAAIGEAIAATPGVAQASPPVPDDPGNPTAVLWQVMPTTAPQDEATTALVGHLRNDVLPPLEQAAGIDVFVTGSVPGSVDFTDYLGERTPLFFAAVLALSFLLLLVVFRSILVPLKAVIMNLLSIGAAYGVVTAIFGWGWLGGLIGVSAGPIEPFVPMMMFAIVFGLSMDYEVFLLSRVREEWQRTGDSRESVANGLAVTARVITAAAAIMVVVFGSFTLEHDRLFKLFGLGLGVAIFLDATVVRMLLVPATMELLGDRNWWLPRWLDRVLPNIDVEGHADDRGEPAIGGVELEGVGVVAASGEPAEL